MAIPIPDKLYFKIGEVAKMVGVEPYVLRYWQTEFPQITPSKSTSRQRLYKRQDVELIVQIKELLYQQKFTIEGARTKLSEIKNTCRDAINRVSTSPSSLKIIKGVVLEMSDYLSQ